MRVHAARRLDSRGPMRALVISDTHFGAWTGRDLLREEFFLERLAPPLDGVDELIFLGDLFDFLFGSVDDAVEAADGLLRLLAEQMEGRRLVFLAGNHDHHLVHRDEEDRLEARLAGRAAGDQRPPGPGFFRASSSAACPGSRSRSPTRPTVSAGSSALTATTSTRTRASAARAATASDPHALGDRRRWPGGAELHRGLRVGHHPLTEWLYIAAQMPHGTHAQQNVFRAAQRAGPSARPSGHRCGERSA